MQLQEGVGEATAESQPQSAPQVQVQADQDEIKSNDHFPKEHADCHMVTFVAFHERLRYPQLTLPVVAQRHVC